MSLAAQTEVPMGAERFLWMAADLIFEIRQMTTLRHRQRLTIRPRVKGYIWPLMLGFPGYQTQGISDPFIYGAIAIYAKLRADQSSTDGHTRLMPMAIYLNMETFSIWVTLRGEGDYRLCGIKTRFWQQHLYTGEVVYIAV